MSTLEEWAVVACRELDLDPASLDVKLVLDVARDVAHGVARPAAPLTAYLLGVAVGQGHRWPDPPRGSASWPRSGPPRAAGAGMRRPGRPRPATDS